MTSADIETLVALVMEWAAAHREWMEPRCISMDGPEYRRYDAARTALLDWKRPAPADTPPEIQEGDVW